MAANTGSIRTQSTVDSNNTTPNDTTDQDQTFDTRALALAIVEAAAEIKARAPRVLDVTGLVSYTDYIVVCHGTSATHVRSIAEHICEDLRPLKIRPHGLEGMTYGEWVLIDFVDVVVHVFHEPFRSEYAIESIYADAPRVDLSELELDPETSDADGGVA